MLFLIFSMANLLWAAPQSPADLALRVHRAVKPPLGVSGGELSASVMGCVLRQADIHIADPLTSHKATVETKIYGPQEAEAPTILLLPPTGGENPLDIVYANALCSKGFRVAIVQNWSGNEIVERDPGMHDRNAIRAMVAIETVLNYLGPTKPVGILGTSVGALAASLALGLDARIQHAVLIVGGSPMSHILARSDEKTLTKLRKQRLHYYGLNSVRQYERFLRKKIEIDSSMFAGFSGPKNILSIVATRDFTVPTAAQNRLIKNYRKAGSNVEAVEIASDHLEVILHSAVAERSRIVAFFQSLMM